jgi:hypothetical protein
VRLALGGGTDDDPAGDTPEPTSRRCELVRVLK